MCNFVSGIIMTKDQGRKQSKIEPCPFDMDIKKGDILSFDLRHHAKTENFFRLSRIAMWSLNGKKIKI